MSAPERSYVVALEESFRTSQSIFASLSRRNYPLTVVVSAEDEACAESALDALRLTYQNSV